VRSLPPFFRQQAPPELTHRRILARLFLHAKLKGIDAGGLAYDAESVVRLAQEAHMHLVIPSRIHRSPQRPFDRRLYRLRHRIENTFLQLKVWRGIAIRYAKNTASFLSALHAGYIAVWAGVY
jgi:hypothetical protein